MKIQHDTTHYTMQVTQRNKKICNVRPLGYTPKSHRECLRSLKYSYFNVSRPHSNKNPNLIRHDINLILYPNFILNYHYSDQISKKENRWSLVFSKASAIHFGCGRRTRTYDLRVMSPASYQLLHPAIFNCSYGAGDRGRTGTVAMTIGF